MTEKTFRLTKDKDCIYVTNTETKQQIRYNLFIKQMQKQLKNGEWSSVDQQYAFFRRFRLADLEFTDKKFENLVLKTKQLNPNCYSISTFIARLGQALIYENYIAQEITTENVSSKEYALTKPLDFYQKHIIHFFKEHNIQVNKNVEDSFIAYYDTLSNLILSLNTLDISAAEKRETFKIISTSWNAERFRDLTTTYKYDSSALIKYLVCYLGPFENVSIESGLSNLLDYYRMASAIGRNVKKYPKYLRSMHDIITSNYNAFQKVTDEEKFSRQLANKTVLEFSNKKYAVTIPKTSKDIISEGTSLNHCVGSYIDKIIEGKTFIMFLRQLDAPDNSLVTLEYINNTIVQAKGAYNRAIAEDEQKFLMEYCQEKKLGLAEHLMVKKVEAMQQ